MIENILSDYNFMRYEIEKKYPDSKTYCKNGKFMVHQMGRNLVSPGYGPELTSAKTVLQAWRNVYITKFVWDKNINRSIRGISKPKGIQFSDNDFKYIN